MDHVNSVMAHIEGIPVIVARETEPQPWWTVSLRAFKANLGRRNYPCYFGRLALEHGELFATFFEDSVKTLAASLTEFLDMSRQHLESRMALAAFHRPYDQPVRELSYAERFWDVLQQLHDMDDSDWPADVPLQPENPAWEYSFHGVPMFVFAAAPTYARRASRNVGPGLVLLFQPRNVFNGIEGGTPRGIKARLVIRDRLSRWDTVPPHPDLADYGDPSNNEWRQYFIPDDQSRLYERCPLHINGGQNATFSPIRSDEKQASQR
ncbi:MAG: YqcI/YcgG family protein [Micromonosporaceae bacterium]